MRWRPDIEGLRAVAILLVVGYHAGLPGFSGGYVGVDVFFVVSGYLISALLVDEWSSEGRIAFGRFYARRARRLLPAAALMLVTTLVVGVLLLAPSELAELARTARAVAVYAGNLVFVGRGTDYFTADPGTDPLLHTWSLAVEEQFYLLWPLLIALLAGLGARWTKPRRALGLGLALGSVASFALCLWLVPDRQRYAFFTVPPRVWEFGIGALAALVPAAWIAGRPRGVRPALASVGLAAVVLACVAFDDLTVFPGWATMLPVLGTALVLAAGSVDEPPPLRPVLSNQPVLWIGRHSYSWYLWHWPALAFALVFWPDPSLTQRVSVVVGSLGVAALAHRFVESPVRARSDLVARPRRGLALGAALALAGVVAALLVHEVGRLEGDRPEQQVLASVPDDVPQVVTDDCIIGFELVEASSPCTYGDLDGSQTAVLFGDSHAGAWFPAVEHVALARGWRLVVLSKASCPTADVDVFLARQRRAFPECTEWRERALRRIESLQPVVTVLANFTNYVGAGEGDDLGVDLDEWAAGARATIERLDDAGLPFVILADPPTPLSNVPTCLARREAALIDGFDCRIDRDHGLNQAFRSIDAELVAASRHGRLVDLVDVFCPDRDCPVRVGEVVRFYDQHHLSATFSASLGPRLDDEIGSVAGRGPR